MTIQTTHHFYGVTKHFDGTTKCFGGVIKCFDETTKCFDGVIKCFDETTKYFDGVIKCFDETTKCFDGVIKGSIHGTVSSLYFLGEDLHLLFRIFLLVWQGWQRNGATCIPLQY